MKFGVVRFPGSNCEQDIVIACRYLGIGVEYVWHGDTELAGFDAVVLPGEPRGVGTGGIGGRERANRQRGYGE